MNKFAYYLGQKMAEKLPELNKGDILLGGRFKNVPMEVKGLKKDDNNQPVVETNKGDRKAFPFRLQKTMPDTSKKKGD